jgi:hypothetical protein
LTADFVRYGTPDHSCILPKPSRERQGEQYGERTFCCQYRVLLCDGFSGIVSCARPGMALQCGMGMSKEEAGSKGGRETVRRYGREWMKELGKRGLRSTANKYFAGSVDECMS